MNLTKQPASSRQQQSMVASAVTPFMANLQLEDTLSQTELAEIWERRAKALATAPPVAASGQTIELLVFWLGNERYGIEVTYVREIFPPGQLTSVPRTPDFVAGVFSARGRILSAVDVQSFLGLSAPITERNKSKARQSHIIVVNNSSLNMASNPIEIGILADEVSDVLTIFQQDIEPCLVTHSGIQAEHTRGITADLMVVLNLATLLSDKRLIVNEEIR